MVARKVARKTASKKPAKASKARPASEAAKKSAAKKAKPARPVKKATAKAKSPKAAAKPKKVAAPKFGRPGTAGKADGDEAVQAWLAGVKPKHREITRKLDELIGATVPGIKRAVKWSSPMYGLPERGWIASMASFNEYVSLNFFAGTSLKPQPPHGEGKGMRRVNLHDLKELDERQVRSWLQQAAALPGWGRL